MSGLRNVAVRCDANATIGLGHLKRCLTLMNQLRLDGFHVRVVSRCPFGSAIEPLIDRFPRASVEDAAPRKTGLDDEVADAEGMLAIIGRRPAGVSWVIVDHYELGAHWETIIRDAGHRILAIDDFRNRSHAADVLVSDTNTPFDPALNACAANARQLTGARFALIDPEFAFAAGEPVSAEGAKRLLVSYGGGDATNETAKALRAVHLLRQDVRCCESLGRVDVVVGHANPRSAEVSRLAAEIEDVFVHVAPQSLAPLMRQADLLLTAGGNSMVEGLSLRKPCLVTLTSENQALMVDQLHEQRVICYLGHHGLIGPQDVAQSVAANLSDYDNLAEWIRANSAFDHFGASRISAAIQSAAGGSHPSAKALDLTCDN